MFSSFFKSKPSIAEQKAALISQKNTLIIEYKSCKRSKIKLKIFSEIADINYKIKNLSNQ